MEVSARSHAKVWGNRMAVLIEAISVVIRLDRLMAAFEEDWDAFKAIVPNDTLCSDNELVRVGFMAPHDVEGFCNVLLACGLRHLAQGHAMDFVVADQQRGFASPCDWAEFGHIDWQGDPARRTPVCRRKGSRARTIMVPEGWEWERSLIASFRFIPLGEPLPEGPGTADAIHSARHVTTGVAQSTAHGFGTQVLSVPQESKAKASFFRRLIGRGRGA